MRYALITTSVINAGLTTMPGCGAGDVKKEKREMSDTITKELEELAETICDNFCKYNETCDDNCECDWIRQGNKCPLDKLL